MKKWVLVIGLVIVMLFSSRDVIAEQKEWILIFGSRSWHSKLYSVREELQFNTATVELYKILRHKFLWGNLFVGVQTFIFLSTTQGDDRSSLTDTHSYVKIEYSLISPLPTLWYGLPLRENLTMDLKTGCGIMYTRYGYDIVARSPSYFYTGFARETKWKHGYYGGIGFTLVIDKFTVTLEQGYLDFPGDVKLDVTPTGQETRTIYLGKIRGPSTSVKAGIKF